MAKVSLEERVSILETELAQLRENANQGRAVAQGDWKIGVAKYLGDADLQIVFQDAKKLRAEDRKRVNSQARKGGASE